jgi:chromosome segregation ATPase
MAEIDRLDADLARVTAERDTLIRQRADDIAALNAVQALHAQAVARLARAEDDASETRRALADALADLAAAQRQVEAMLEVVEAAQAVESRLRTGLPMLATISDMTRALDALRAALAVPSTNGVKP